MKLNSLINSRFKQAGLSIAASFLFFGLTPLATTPFVLAQSDQAVAQTAYSDSELVSSKSVATGASPVFVAAAPGEALVANYTANNFQIFNMKNANAPVLLSTTKTGTGSHPDAIIVSGSYAYVADFGNGNNGSQGSSIQVFNISKPTAPVLLNGTGYFIGYGPDDFQIKSNYLFVTQFGPYANSSVMSIIDISNPHSLKLVRRIAIPAGPNHFEIVGNYMYVIGDLYLQIYDIAGSHLTNPVSEIPGGTTGYEINYGLTGIAISGSDAYITVGFQNTLEVFNVSNPAHPSLVNGYGAKTDSLPVGIVIKGNYEYVISATSNRLQTFMGLGHPSYRSGVVTQKTPYGIVINPTGNYLYVVNYKSDTIQTFSLSNPAKP
jgi:hypothetical protein